MPNSWKDLSEKLGTTSNEGLLSTYGSLTHQIHEAKNSDHETDLRARRMFVQNEILRRMK